MFFKKKLNACTNENTPKFSLNGKVVTGKVVRVVDGDTVYVAFKCMKKYYKFNCRILGIDTPEMHKHGELAVMAKQATINFCLDKICTVKCGEFDNFGRLLVEVFVGNENLADYLVKKKLAKVYDGKTKSTFDDLFKFYNINIETTNN